MKSDRSRRTPASDVNFSEGCPVTFTDLLKGAVNTCPACAVIRRFSLVGTNPTRYLSFQLVAAKAIHGGNDMD